MAGRERGSLERISASSLSYNINPARSTSSGVCFVCYSRPSHSPTVPLQVCLCGSDGGAYAVCLPLGACPV